eukprot:6195715-Pleurochrysis_carterae.AAC.4
MTNFSTANTLLRYTCATQGTVPDCLIPSISHKAVQRSTSAQTTFLYCQLQRVRASVVEALVHVSDFMLEACRSA